MPRRWGEVYITEINGIRMRSMDMNFRTSRESTMKYGVALVLAALLGLSTPLHSDEMRRDGAWWLSLAESTKLSYLVGVFDGAQIGRDFATWKNQSSKNKKAQECAMQAMTSFVEYDQKFLGNTTNGQIVDGLNEFYGDYRNRRITLQGGIWLVVNSIAGTPQKELADLVLAWRKNDGT